MQEGVAVRVRASGVSKARDMQSALYLEVLDKYVGDAPVELQRPQNFPFA